MKAGELVNERDEIRKVIEDAIQGASLWYRAETPIPFTEENVAIVEQQITRVIREMVDDLKVTVDDGFRRVDLIDVEGDILGVLAALPFVYSFMEGKSYEVFTKRNGYIGDVFYEKKKKPTINGLNAEFGFGTSFRPKVEVKSISFTVVYPDEKTKNTQP